MAKFTRKDAILEAHQWFKNGDHPLDYINPRLGSVVGGPTHFTPEQCKAHDYEGELVRRFRRPDVPGNSICLSCGTEMNKHGFLDFTALGKTVCPGDWVITYRNGQHSVRRARDFLKVYEEIHGAGINGLKPVYPTPEDPCPQCKPGSHCRTPNCGRLKKLDNKTSDAHKAYVKMKRGCYTGDPKDQPDYGPYIHGYMDRDLVPTSPAERILSRLTMAIPLEDTLKATIDGESLIHYFKTLISNSRPSVGQVVK